MASGYVSFDHIEKCDTENSELKEDGAKQDCVQEDGHLKEENQEITVSSTSCRATQIIPAVLLCIAGFSQVRRNIKAVFILNYELSRPSTSTSYPYACVMRTVYAQKLKDYKITGMPSSVCMCCDFKGF